MRINYIKLLLVAGCWLLVAGCSTTANHCPVWATALVAAPLGTWAFVESIPEGAGGKGEPSVPNDPNGSMITPNSDSNEYPIIKAVGISSVIGLGYMMYSGCEFK